MAKQYPPDFLPQNKVSSIDLLLCHGPFASSSNSELFLDASSQMSTVSHGFNNNSLFGVAHHQNAWLNAKDNHFFQIMMSFKQFLARKLAWKESFFQFTHSGSEANETALWECWGKRKNQAKKILAFEGSFHGRSLVSLATTWNKQKRIPFQWDDELVSFAPYPSCNSSQINQRFPPKWESLTSENISIFVSEDQLLQKEINSLLLINQKLSTQEFFAIIIEPMQGEGGDNYSSDRFHYALLKLAQEYGVPVIYDEIQTGFLLGLRFFWHQQFELKGLKPHFITCAKKAQVGIVISSTPLSKHVDFSATSCIRGLIQGTLLNQSHQRILKLYQATQKFVTELKSEYPKFIHQVNSKGLAFSLEFHNSQIRDVFLKESLSRGVFCLGAGEKTVRFRLNLSFKKKSLDLLFSLIRQTLNNEGPNHLTLNDSSQNFAIHQSFVQKKLDIYCGREGLSFKKFTNFFSQTDPKLIFISIDSSNFLELSMEIKKIQTLAYEPERRTTLEEFQNVLNMENSFAIGIFSQKTLIGISFAAPLKNFHYHFGVQDDPYQESDDVLYMVDVSIHPDFRGKSLGKMLKYCMAFLGMEKGFTRIHGRTRDQIASAMYSINTSLGSYEYKYYPEYYNDNYSHKGLIYYHSQIAWKSTALNLSQYPRQLLSLSDLSTKFIKKSLPALVNKISLCRFTTEEVYRGFLYLKKHINLLFQNFYHSSGESESLDKVFKSLWQRNKCQSLLVLEGSSFGDSTFLAKSLTNPENSFFDCQEVSFSKDLNKELEKILKNRKNYLGFFVEPFQRKSMKPIPHKVLKKIKAWCSSKKIPLIYNETYSQHFHYSLDHLFLVNSVELAPDISILSLGNQMALTMMKKDFFINTPSTMISTWDGDLFSFLSYIHYTKNILNNLESYKNDLKNFDEVLSNLFKRNKIKNFFLVNGLGFFEEQRAKPYQKYFSRSDDENFFIIAPHYSALREALKEPLLFE